MSSTERATSIKLNNPGPLDAWEGPYNSIAEACAAIPNTVNEGQNMRLGKKPLVIENGKSVQYWWPNGDYSDSSIVRYVDTSALVAIDQFSDIVQLELDKDGTNTTTETKTFGVNDIGTAGGDGFNAGSFKYNEQSSAIDVDGNIKTVEIHIQTAGTLYLAIMRPDETIRKVLPVVNVVVGLNTININEPTTEGEFLGFGGANGTAKVAYGSTGSGGIQGERFVQKNLGTGAKVFGPDNSSYSYKFTVDYEVGTQSPLYSAFPKKAETLTKDNYSETLSEVYLEQSQFQPVLQAEIDKGGTAIVEYGTELTGDPTKEDGVGSTVFKYNSPISKVTKDGSLKKITISIKTAGTLYFSIGVSNGTAFTLRKTLPVFNAVVGVNTFVVNEPMYANEILAIGGQSGTAKMHWASSGIPGTYFIQQNSTSITATGGAGSYYAFGFEVEEQIPNLFDPFVKSEELRGGNPANVAILSDLNPTKHIITVRKNGTVGVDCDFTGNAGIKDAIDSIIDAVPGRKEYLIIVYPGVYEALTSAEFNGGGISQSGSTQACFIRGKSGVSIRGTERDAVIIKGELPDNLTASVYQYHQTMYWHADHGMLENVIVTGKNLRYPIHIDDGNNTTKNYISNFKNVRSIHYGNSGNALAWTAYHAFGIGTSDGMELYFEDCDMESGSNGVYAHNNANFKKGSKLHHLRCRLENTGTNKRVAVLQSLGSNNNDILTFQDCLFDGGYIIVANDTPYIPNDLKGQSFNHCNILIKGSGNPPFIYRPDFRGKALRITSKTTGVSSSVRFDVNSSAFPIIIKDKDYVSGSFATDSGEVNSAGYAYSDGVTGLAGYAIGRLDIGEDAVGISSNLYIKSLGKRLGDCSVVNKTLTVTIDGVSYDIVFNKNYIGSTTNEQQSAYSNAQIISEINAVIGTVATVTEYAVGNDYFPEFTDVVSRMKADELILKGMPVYMNSNRSVRRSLSTDPVLFGVALETIKPGFKGRILRRGYIDYDNSLNFYVRHDATASAALGQTFGISSDTTNYPGSISLTATTKFFTAIDANVLSFNI